jgi:oleate hydratase
MGAGIGSLSAAYFLIKDGNYKGDDITIYESLDIPGGSLDANGNAESGFMLRGGRMFTSTTFECYYEMCKGIPSLQNPGQSVYDDMKNFEKVLKTDNKTRLVNDLQIKLDQKDMQFSMAHRLQLLKLLGKNEVEIGSTKISEWFQPDFFRTNFWSIWQTMFAFQTWSSAIELRRYMNRFIHMFPEIDTMKQVNRTPMSQYTSIILPLVAFLKGKGVKI